MHQANTTFPNPVQLDERVLQGVAQRVAQLCFAFAVLWAFFGAAK